MPGPFHEIFIRRTKSRFDFYQSSLSHLLLICLCMRSAKYGEILIEGAMPGRKGGAAIMLRLVISLVLVAILAFRQGGDKSLGSVAGMDSRITLTQTQHTSRTSGEHEKHREVPLDRCHHVSCSQTFLPNSHFLLIRRNTRSEMHLVANEHNLHTIILDRDPPIPRSLI